MPSTDRSDLFPGALEMMVLQTLRRGPLHGYALAQAIKQPPTSSCTSRRALSTPRCNSCSRPAGSAAEWRHLRPQPAGAYLQVDRGGRKQLERKVSAFERLLSGIAKVMKAQES